MDLVVLRSCGALSVAHFRCETYISVTFDTGSRSSSVRKIFPEAREWTGQGSTVGFRVTGAAGQGCCTGDRVGSTALSP